MLGDKLCVRMGAKNKSEDVSRLPTDTVSNALYSDCMIEP